MADLGDRLRRARLPTRVGYIVILLLATLARLGFDPEPAAVAARIVRALHPSFSNADAIDAVRNTVLFAGWGLVWLMTSPPGPAMRQVRASVITGACLSTFIETVQLVSPFRTTSILDVTFNTLGALLGAVGAIVLVRVANRFHGKKSFLGVPAITFAGAYIAVVAVDAAFPGYRSGRLPGVGYKDVATRLAIALVSINPRTLLHPPLSELALFAPAGAFVVLACVELGKGYGAGRTVAIVGGLALSVAGELFHGAMGYPIHLGAIAAHAAGIALGGILAARWLPGLTAKIRGADRPAVLYLFYALLLAAWSWRPFLINIDPGELAAVLSPEHLIPLRSGQRLDLNLVADVMIGFLLYMPLGALLAVWPLRRVGALRGFLPALYLAFITEAGQLLIEGRFVDVTDALIACAGAAIGWVAIRRAGYAPYGEVIAKGPTYSPPSPAQTRSS